MAGIIIPYAVDRDEKVALMQQDARFEMTDADAANMARAAAIRNTVRGQKALPKAPKVFLTNDCVFNCAYCDCREGNDCKRRYASTPRELAELAYRQAKADGHGIFVTSAIHRNPDYTEELIIRTLQILRREMGYTGYLHAKVMPGTDPGLIREAGLYADRLSVNIEVAQSTGYTMIAKNKNKGNILTPMRQIRDMIAEAKHAGHTRGPRFATSQTTQIMAGSTGEDDFTILNLSGALYDKFHLKRVYYTSFHYTEPAAGYDGLPSVITPKWRMNRLYQADRLMQLYGFSAEEITPPTARFLTEDMDPKCAWAMRNLHLFPVEVNRADYEMLIRVPGIGVTYARRILAARAEGIVTHDVLRQLGVALGRSRHFITCNGRYWGRTCDNIETLYPLLAEAPQQLSMDSVAMAGCV